MHGAEAETGSRSNLSPGLGGEVVNRRSRSSGDGQDGDVKVDGLNLVSFPLSGLCICILISVMSNWNGPDNRKTGYSSNQILHLSQI